MRELKGDWRDLFHCFMIALDLRKLLLSFIAGAVTVLTVYIVTYCMGTMVNQQITADVQEAYEFGVLPITVRFHLFKVLLPCLCAIFSSASWALLYMAVMVPFLSVVWSYFGGAITRIASVEIAKDERLETQKALEYVQHRYGSYFWSLVASALGFLFFFGVNAAVAFPGRWWLIGWLLQPILMALLPLALLSGFIMVLIAIGTVFGYPLFYPAISAEGTDSFDAISRGFSYVYSKPWHYALYQLVAAGYGVVCVGFVWLFGWLMLKLTVISCGFGFGAERMNQFVLFAMGDLPLTGDRGFSAHPDYGGFLPSVAAVFFTVWMVIAVGFVLSYAISFCLSSQTMIYYLLRKKVDGIEMNEVYEERAEEQAPLPEKPAAAPAGASPSGAKSEGAVIAPPPAADAVAGGGGTSGGDKAGNDVKP